LVIIELKNPADENATIWSAFQQLQTYKSELPTLFGFNELLVISDGVEARLGTLTAGREWFKPWRTISGETLADAHTPELSMPSLSMLPSRLYGIGLDFGAYLMEVIGKMRKVFNADVGWNQTAGRCFSAFFLFFSRFFFG
jgi:hypothetical protein